MSRRHVGHVRKSPSCNKSSLITPVLSFFVQISRVGGGYKCEVLVSSSFLAPPPPGRRTRDDISGHR